MSKIFSLKNLHKLDGGKAVIAINHALGQAVADIQDRPGDKAKRKVIVTFTMEPELDKDLAVLDTVGMQIKIDTKIPVRQTAEYKMQATKGGALMFSESSPFDPKQQDMFPGKEDDDDSEDEKSDVQTL